MLWAYTRTYLSLLGSGIGVSILLHDLDRLASGVRNSSAPQSLAPRGSIETILDFLEPRVETHDHAAVFPIFAQLLFLFAPPRDTPGFFLLGATTW